ncbi:glycosyltransferase family 2 protein [Parapedobacter lycopersici]|uniref:glycosyltransferase family 2 protein n=1 Tax=Parapedobacter lycopersici TaxID=1864939 RepID=UPI00214D71AA|nr:glycosyltransferase family 2 protein [Parapedobacter lycopersici]
MAILFWLAIGIVCYAFVGYGVVLYLLVKLKRALVSSYPINDASSVYPTVTLLVAAYNEADIIGAKIENTLDLDYPEERLQLIFITDGSDDDTPAIVGGYSSITLLHQPERRGKMAAIKRAMTHVQGEITIFTDGNTFLNPEAVKQLVKHYQNPKVGAVAGEKRIKVDRTADASAAGEGFYWKYESKLKKLDYAFYSNVGAAGELFSIRTALYPPVETDTIIDDHMIAMRIAEKGFIIAYEPAAYAMETASENTSEELKRKIRIAAGGLQSILRLPKAANPFFYPLLTFQYISHRVLRWTIVPFLLPLIFILNGVMVAEGTGTVYVTLFAMQLLFYGMAVIGWLLEGRQLRIKLFFIPYYFCLMNYAVIAGIFRYLRGNQAAAWEKSKRKTELR